MNVGSVCEHKMPEEDPDWGYARACRALLRRPDAEFMQSVHSVDSDGFTTPNRDYPLEGLTAVVGGENWKFLDALPFRLEYQARPLRLKAAGVKIYPWKAEYSYRVEGLGAHAALEVEYYLLRKPRFPSLNVAFRLAGARHTALFLKPFFDIRHMYSHSDPQEHSHDFSESRLRVLASGREALVASPSFTGFAPSAQAVQQWWYKMGSGSREDTDGGIRFSGETRSLYAPGVLTAELNGEVGIQVSCGDPAHEPAVELRNHDEKRERARAARLLEPFSAQLDSAGAKWGKAAQRAIAGRLLCLLDKFEFSAPSIDAPDAGSMWFRNAWFRDAFEGVRNNLPLYFKTRKRGLRGLAYGALRLSKEGRVPNKLAERSSQQPDYSATDATLLCYLTALDLLALQRDAALAQLLRQESAKFISACKTEGAIGEDGLLYTPARHSWIDSTAGFPAGGGTASAPSRIPREWLAEYSHMAPADATRAAHTAKFALVEVNAMWLLVLRGLALRGVREAAEISERAEESFTRKFLAGGRMAGIADIQGRRDFAEASTCIEALALLPDLFSEAEARSILDSKAGALVHRDKRLFGVLVRDSGGKVFYGDGEYHGAVCWPRDSHYLFKVLQRLGDARAEEILLAHLGHQMEEGAVFYSHELFSLPEGRNPSPAKSRNLPVPVKNPAQYFSQWCQPYFDFLEGGKQADGGPK
ncbi:MAG: hypothetical protein V1787_01410 [Candidatus Micrarchaeota archaeon]